LVSASAWGSTVISTPQVKTAEGSYTSVRGIETLSEFAQLRPLTGISLAHATAIIKAKANKLRQVLSRTPRPCPSLSRADLIERSIVFMLGFSSR